MVNRNIQAFEKLQELGRLLLLKAYKDMGVFIGKGERYLQQDVVKKAGIVSMYAHLNEALLQILLEAGFIHMDGELFVSSVRVDEVELGELEKKKASIIRQYPVITSHINLLWECLVNYRDILRGNIPATQVMFPESAMELVEGVYKGNEICDFFNLRVAKSVRLYLDARLSKPGTEEKINILEIGAGTGGTSTFILKEIKPYENHINYVYTDVSQAFTIHGEKIYFKSYPFMQFKVLDIEKDIESQGIDLNKYDIIIGANVLHATKNIASTLMNAKRLLKKNGWIILNELTQRWEFATLTFGLLSGWWLSQDKEARIRWSPLLSEDMWKKSLTLAGFRNIISAGAGENAFDNFSQHVIIGESDGVVYSRNIGVNDIKTDKTEAAPGLNNFKEDNKYLAAANSDRISHDDLKEFVYSQITGIVADILHIKKNKISGNVPLWDYGVDSILIGIIVSKVNKALGVSLKNSDLFSYSTIQKLAEYLAANDSSKVKSAYSDCLKADSGESISTQNKAEKDVINSKSDKAYEDAMSSDRNPKPDKGGENLSCGDIAVIGVAGRFPMAENILQYRKNIEEGRNCISEIPSERWNMADFYHPTPGEPGKSYCKYGGLLSDIDKFDPLFFNLSPKQAELMDPRQRLFLQEAWRVIEDAGYSRKLVEGKKLGVFLGSEGDTEYLTERFDYPEDYSSHLFLGNSNSIMAARISYFMDLKGPCVTIDTACSSSLVAIHEACESLRTGNCDMAIAGGVQIMLTPRSYLLLSKMSMLSPDGKCKTFDNSANGFVPGEAAAAILLKPLSQAIKDKDHIYCVIKGSATNQDGKSNGITAPNVLAQEQLEYEVYNKYGISPETITYVEAHGTGTKLGDPVEVDGLTKAFARFTSRKQYCAIGSVKSNIGHAGAAAGISGLIKVVLALKNKRIPPSINFREANEQIDFKNTPFYVNTELKEWDVEPGLPRRAAISSFGHSGTNCHIVLEEAPVYDAAENRMDAPCYIVALSAETMESQKSRVEDLRLWLKEQGRSFSIADISYTSFVGRSHMSFRSALIVRTHEDFENSLDLLANGGIPANYVCNFNGQKDTSTTVSVSALEALISELDSNINEALYIRKLFEIAGIYVNGADFTGEKLFANKGCRRISMPAYPFEKNRHWILDISGRFKKTQKLKQKTAALHPLLGINTSTLKEQSYKTTFDGSEFYFNEHIVKGQKVLPGVAHIEMVRAAGELAGERKAGRIRNIVWARPIIHDKEQLDIVVNLYPVKDYVDFQVSTLARDGKKEVNSQGRIFYESGECKVREIVDIDEIKNRCSMSISGDECYLKFTEFGMNLGMGFRVTDKIWIGKSEVISHIKLPDSQRHSFEDYTLHPSIMDGTLQAMIGLMDSGEKRLYIPYALGEIEILSELGDECYSFVSLSNEQVEGDPDVRKFNVKVINKNSEVILNIKEVLARPVNWEEQECEITYIKEEWQQEALETLSKESEKLSDTDVLVFSEELDDIGAIEAIATRGSKEKPRIIFILKGSAFEGETPNIYRINPLDINDFYRLFNELEANNITPRKIVFMAKGIYINNAEGMDDIWQNSYFTMFNLVKSLSKYDSIPDKQIVYSFKSKANAPLNAAVRGFAAAVQKENPGIKIKTVEFEGGFGNPAAELETLLEELLKYSGNGREDVLYKSGIRHTRKYKQVNLEKDKAESIKVRHGGVYLITGGAGGLGSIFAEYFARCENVKLVLSGRSDRNQKIEGLLDKLHKLGSEVIYIKADVSKREEVNYILAETEKHFGAINGIIHSAGMVKDAFIQKKSVGDMSDVIRPKVNGLIYLDELAKERQLDFFAAFSSISSVLGNAGQCDYSYANSFMNYFALLREKLRSEGKRKGKTVSIAWPLWINGGMNVDKATKELIYTTMGVKGLSNEKGLEIFKAALMYESGFIAVFEGKREKILNSLGLGGGEREPENAVKPMAIGTDSEAGDRNFVAAAVRKSVTEVMNIREQDINTAKNLSAYGFDSISFTDLSNSINRRLSLEITPAVFFQYPSIDSIVDYLVKNFMKDIITNVLNVEVKAASQANDNALAGETVQLSSFSETRFVGSNDSLESVKEEKDSYEEPVAVIGMSGVFPGSENLGAYWEHLENGDDLISEIPSDRWDWKAYYGDPKKEPNKTNVKWGGFIDSVDKFDASYFRISPREARLMDPQQRIVMEMVWKAIEDAGYKASDLAGTDTALFVGVSAIDYSELINEYGVQPEAYTSTGIAHSVLVNRISFLLDIHGPSEPVDTACSSSLVAIHRGVEALQSGRSEIAIVGGANVLLSPSVYISFSKAGMLCEDGRCKTFDKNANGYVRGEGAGIIILKSLSKAQADGDHIYAVIKGSAQNHGGKANSLTAPNPNAQADVIKSALKKAKIPSATISYIEAHGSGTSLGDPIEVNGLIKAFSELKDEMDFVTSTPHTYCGIGSVKTNIGHLEAAAGIAGIIKVILAMKNKKIPASINFKELNPYIKLEGTPFYIADGTKDWELLKDDRGMEIPRRAGVSSFGFGGANAHIVVEEYLENATPDPEQNNKSNVIVLSAKNAERLKVYAANLANFLERQRNRGKGSELSFGDLAYTLQVGREALEERLALVASCSEEAIEKLKMYCSGRDSIDGLYTGNIKSESNKVDLLIDGVEGQEFLKYILAGHRYDKIAKLWAGGIDIDWNLMYSGRRLKRLSLPTYPFARDRYWIPKGTLNQKVESFANQSTAIEEKSSILKGFGKKSYSKKISVSEPVVRDHTIHEKPVLPGVGHIEFACKAFRELTGIAEFDVSRVVWLVPFAMDSEDKEIIAAFEEKQGSCTYEIQSISGGNTVIHSRGMITPCSHSGKTREDKDFDIEAIEGRCANWIKKEDFYSQFRKTCVNHGPYFQGLCRLGWSDGEAIAKVEMPAEFENELKQSVLHPTVMDCSLQAIAGIAVNLFRKDGQPMLPFAIENIEVLKPFGRRVYSYVKQSGNDRFNVLLLDENGSVCVAIKDVALRELKDQLQGYFFLPAWKHVPLSRLNQEKKDAASEGKVVVVYNPPEEGFAIGLSKLLENEDTVFAKLSSETKKLGKEKWSIDYTLAEGFVEFFKGTGPIKTIYFLGGINTACIENQDLALLDEAQERGIVCLFRLAKALNTNGYDQSAIEIKVLTNNLRKIYPDDIIAPLSGGLTGFAMSMAKEYPGWEICLIDIDSREIGDEKLTESVITECGCVGGKEVAFRKSRRFEMSIEPIWLPPANTSPFKKDGVYVIVGGAGGIGMVFADYLTGTIGAKVALIGRSELSDDRQYKVDKIRSRGGEVLYIRADMTSLEMMEKAVSKIKSHFGRINAVIHSAIVLKDRTLETMNEEDLRAVLAPKALGTVILHKVFKKEKLDFMMFFSSSQSFTASLGQSNYAAACTFKDAYANYIAETGEFPVHIVNWGFWGAVGVVASEEYNRRLAAKGVGSITSDEGIEAVRRIISHNTRQVMTLKANAGLLKSIGINMERSTVIYTPHNSPLLSEQTGRFKAAYPYPEAVSISDKAFEYVEDYGRRMLLKAFRKMGVFLASTEKYILEDLRKHLGIIPAYERLYLELVNILAEAGFVKVKGKTVTGGAVIGKKGFEEELELIESKGAALAEEYPGIKPHISLLTKCIENYPGILCGKIKATEIIFPGSSMGLVEGIYKGNETVDYYNSIVSGCIKEYLKQRLSTGKRAEKIKILEVGAGTGGTSDSVLKGISCHGEDIRYYYTDISPAFINHGKRQYGNANPFVEFKLLNIEKDCLEQGFTPGDFDIALATNVLHATRRIEDTLNNIKRLLKKNGWVVINETTRKLLFTTLTFGLLEGWWLYEDGENRISGGPVLGPGMWERVLKEEGFGDVVILGGNENDNKQQSRQNVIIGESNGVVSYVSGMKAADFADINTGHPVKDTAFNDSCKEMGEADKAQVNAGVSRNTDGLSKYVQETVIVSVAKTLGVSQEDINYKKQFYEYGMDSISTMELTNKLNEALGIAIRTTALFDYGNVKDLTEYIVREFGSRISMGMVADTEVSPIQAEAPLKNIAPQASGIKAQNRGRKNTDDIKKLVEKRIIESVSTVIGEPAGNIDTVRPFFEYGVDSISAMDLINIINEIFGINLRSTAIFDFGNVKDLAQYILDSYPEKLLSLIEDSTDNNETIKDLEGLSGEDALKVIFQKLAKGELSADEADKMMGVIYE